MTLSSSQKSVYDVVLSSLSYLHSYPHCILILVASLSVLHLYLRYKFSLVASLSPLHNYPHAMSSELFHCYRGHMISLCMKQKRFLLENKYIKKWVSFLDSGWVRGSTLLHLISLLSQISKYQYREHLVGQLTKSEVNIISRCWQSFGPLTSPCLASCSLFCWRRKTGWGHCIYIQMVILRCWRYSFDKLLVEEENLEDDA